MGDVVFFPEVGEVEEEEGANAITLTSEGKLASEEIDGFVLSLRFVLKFRIEYPGDVVIQKEGNEDAKAMVARATAFHKTMKKAAEAFRENCVGKMASLLNEPARVIRPEAEEVTDG